MNSGIAYDGLSITSAIALTRVCLNTNIDVFKYHAEQSIGGECKTYVIDTLHGFAGWYQDDGTIKADDHAPTDALQKIRDQQDRALRKQIEKEYKIKQKNQSG